MSNDRAIIEKIASHIGTERLISLAQKAAYCSRNDGYGEPISPALAGTIIHHALFTLLKEGQIALVKRDNKC